MYAVRMNKLFFKAILRWFMISMLALIPYIEVSASEGYEEARLLSRAGEIKPLNDILLSIKKEIPGTVLEVELERKHNKLVYEIEILQQQGIVKEVYVDARTGEIISIKGGD